MAQPSGVHETAGGSSTGSRLVIGMGAPALSVVGLFGSFLVAEVRRR